MDTIFFAACIVFAAFVLIGFTVRKPPTIDAVGQAYHDPQVDEINHNKCPDCGSDQLLAGPSGGMSQNVLCNGCLMEWNVHFGFGTGAFRVDRTGKAGVSRARIFGISPEEHRDIEDRLYREALS